MPNVAIKVALVRNGRVLCIKRSSTEEWCEELWDLPGGRVEDGEDVYDAIQRELKEEIGVAPELDFIPVRVWSVKERNLIGITFMAQVGELEIKLGPEHTEYRWISKEELASLPMHPGLRKDIEKVFELQG